MWKFPFVSICLLISACDDDSTQSVAHIQKAIESDSPQATATTPIDETHDLGLVLAWGHREASWAALESRMRQRFNQYDPAGDGIDSSDIEIVAARQTEKRVAKLVTHELIRDANKDGTITHAEVVAYETATEKRWGHSWGQSQGSSPRNIIPLEDRLEAFRSRTEGWDIDEDGSLSGSEIETGVRAYVAGEKSRLKDYESLDEIQDDLVLVELAHFFDEDDVLKHAEYLDLIRDSLEILVMDDSGNFDIHELREAMRHAAKRTRGRLGIVRSAALCTAPAVDPQNDLIMLNVSSGLGLSSVRLGSVLEPTSYGEITIADPTKPIDLVLLVHNPFVFKISDRSSSLRSITVFGAPVGFIGVDPSLLRSAAASCPLIGKHFHGDVGKRALKAIEIAVNGKSAFETGTTFFGGLVLPSNEPTIFEPENTAPLSSDPMTALRQIFDLHYPLGLVALDANEVHSSNGEKTVYDVAPHVPGLLKLIEDGAISPLDRSNRVKIGESHKNGSLKVPGFRFKAGSHPYWRSGTKFTDNDGFVFTNITDGRWVGVPQLAFAVHREITMPGGLDSFFLFVLDEGVPPPNAVAIPGPKVITKQEYHAFLNSR